MHERLKRLFGWLRCLFVSTPKQPALTFWPCLPRLAASPWCRSWPVPRHGKTGAAAIKRAARQHRNRRRTRCA